VRGAGTSLQWGRLHAGRAHGVGWPGTALLSSLGHSSGGCHSVARTAPFGLSAASWSGPLPSRTATQRSNLECRRDGRAGIWPGTALLRGSEMSAIVRLIERPLVLQEPVGKVISLPELQRRQGTQSAREMGSAGIRPGIAPLSKIGHPLSVRHSTAHRAPSGPLPD